AQKDGGEKEVELICRTYTRSWEQFAKTKPFLAGFSTIFPLAADLNGGSRYNRPAVASFPGLTRRVFLGIEWFGELILIASRLTPRAQPLAQPNARPKIRTTLCSYNIVILRSNESRDLSAIDFSVSAARNRSE